jgi:hypothetical protein
MTLGDLICTANHWQPGMGRTPSAPSWSIFDDRPGQDATERAVRQGCKLLATRIDRNAGETLVESARRQLTDAVHAYIAARTPAPPAPKVGWLGYIGICLAAIIGGLLLGRFLRSNFGHFLFRSLCRGLIYRAVRAF